MPSISLRSLVQNGWSLRFTASKNRLNLKGRKSGVHRHLYSQGRCLGFCLHFKHTPRLNKMDGFDHRESVENLRPITFYFIFYLRSHLLLFTTRLLSNFDITAILCVCLTLMNSSDMKSSCWRSLILCCMCDISYRSASFKLCCILWSA